jgi:hypothetical protein
LKREEDELREQQRIARAAFRAKVDAFVEWVIASGAKLESAAAVIAGAPDPHPEPEIPPFIPPDEPVEIDDRDVKPVKLMERLPPAIWAEIQKASAASGTGILPIVQAAVAVHETGWFTSRLWHEANNVGGVKWSSYAEGLGASRDSGGTFAAWPTWQAGIMAHARFFAQKRYGGIRETFDPREQVRAIHLAGYAEVSESWLRDVLAFVSILERGQDRPSPHFTWEEVARSDRAEAAGVANIVPANLRPGIREFATGIVEPLRDALGRPMKYGVDWMSWYRSTALNALVGGAPGSDHLTGRGIDVPRTEEFWRALRAARVTIPLRVNAEPDHYDVKVGVTIGTVEVNWINGATKAAWEV